VLANRPSHPDSSQNVDHQVAHAGVRRYVALSALREYAPTNGTPQFRHARD
jgi:hypothetical protein